MPLDTITSIAMEGKRPSGIPIEDDEQVKELARNWRDYWHGL